MTNQAYLQIQNNVVTNNVMWDGDTQTWQPPSDATMLIKADINAMLWRLNNDKTAFELVEFLGAGEIGFTWDGSVLTTNQPQPIYIPQPQAVGLQTA
jgi:hypothetical protein